MKAIRVLLVIICSSVLLLSCSWWNKDDDDDNSPFKGMSAKQLYTEAKQAIKKEQYTAASKRLEALETMYPFNDYAEKAQMELVYTYYKQEDYPSCAATAERFIHLYPRAKHVDYAYYMKGLANFQQLRGALSQMFPIDESWRDPGTQNQAYADFSALIQRFPDSKYRNNAVQRMIYLRNMFAQHEYNIAKYYYDRRMYVAAVGRANTLIQTYPQAPSVQSALMLAYQANQKLGLYAAAKEVATVYQATYHKSIPTGTN